MNIAATTQRFTKHLGFCLRANDYGAGYAQRRRFNQAVFISPTHKFVFVKNEKAANLTLRKTLQTLEAGGALPPGYHTNRRWTGPLLQPSDIEDFGDHVLRGGDYFRFAVVRNPFVRMLSCFRDKFENIKLDRKFWRVHNNLGLAHDRVSISFEEFVDRVCIQNSEDMNPHWRIQHDNIYFDRISFDTIVKFENLTEEMPQIIDRWHTGSASLLARRHHLTNADAHLQDYYTDKIAKKVREKFAVDFDVFGYEDKMPDGVITAPVDGPNKKAIP